MADQAGRKAARHVLRALIQGEDPATGKALEPGSVVHRLEVMRALALALEALTEVQGGGRTEEVKEQRKGAKKGPDRAGQGWSRAEDDELRRLFGQRRQIADLAVQLGRTTGAIAARLVRLGLVNERSEARGLLGGEAKG
ncbi:hypothetical protein GRAN_3221 [Granulicella sibirica]|uniref:Uncharacterized protein n=2 Tax=Granulicella sibirica TaxID=2479048 RepID=A0A4V1L5N3_9BACT|nr:hypothetical protein GRAN_3221 [Granulicella sibirica]